MKKTKTSRTVEKLAELYREESPKPAVIAMIVAVALVGAPLAYANKLIENNGRRAADVSKIVQMAKQLKLDVLAVIATLTKGTVSEALLKESGVPVGRGYDLITPDNIPTNMSDSGNDPNEFDFSMSAIYFNPPRSLVTIDDENYREGDKVKGFTILEIRETSVTVRSPAGETKVLNFYDYLK